MFHKKEIDLYRSITAPDSLKESVLEMEVYTSGKPWYEKHIGWLATCASIVLLLSSVLLFTLSSSKTTVMVQGEVISETPTEFAYAASYAKASNYPESDNLFSVILKINIAGNTTITVSDGTLYNIEDDTQSGQTIILTEDANINWSIVPEDTPREYFLTVVSGNGTDTYLLKTNSNTGIYTISQQ